MGRLVKDTTLFFVQRHHMYHIIYHMSHIKKGWDLCKNPLFKPFFPYVPYYLMSYGTYGTYGIFGTYEHLDDYKLQIAVAHKVGVNLFGAVNALSYGADYERLTGVHIARRVNFIYVGAV